MTSCSVFVCVLYTNQIPKSHATMLQREFWYI